MNIVCFLFTCGSFVFVSHIHLTGFCFQSVGEKAGTANADEGGKLDEEEKWSEEKSDKII